MPDKPREPAKVPRWLQGAWRREGLARGSSPFVERSDVLWLQSCSYFADLRIPHPSPAQELDVLDMAQAFSGVGTYEPPRFTWFHEIDTREVPAGQPDVADLEEQAALLIERGADYVERWRREDDACEVAVYELTQTPGKAPHAAPLARIVMVGHLAVGVWRTPGSGSVSFKKAAGGWIITATLGNLDHEQGMLEEVLAGLNAGRMNLAGWVRK